MCKNITQLHVPLKLTKQSCFHCDNFKRQYYVENIILQTDRQITLSIIHISITI